MQRALFTAELVTHIVGYLDDKSTVACASVCKLWSEPALDRIWMKLRVDSDEENNEADNLFKLLFREDEDDEGSDNSDESDSDDEDCDMSSPTGSSDESETESDISSAHEKSDGVSKEWLRFTFYAKRVRDLSFITEDQQPRKAFTHSVKAKISNDCPFQCILPNLHRLYLRFGTDANGLIAYVSRFFGESLQGLVLFVEGVPDLCNLITPETRHIRARPVIELANSIIQASPNIRRFAFYYTVFILQDEVESGVAVLLSGLCHLTSFTCESAFLTPQILDVAMRLPHLTKLVIGSTIDSVTAVRRISSQIKQCKDAFPNLTCLRLHTTSLKDFSTILSSHSCFKRLEKLTLMVYVNRTDEYIHRLFSTIAAHERLQALFLDMLEYSTLVVESASISASSLAPIKALHSLTILVLKHRMPTSLTDEDLCNLVADCPTLSWLCILPIWSSFSSPEAATRFTLDALTRLSHQPNRLELLRFALCEDQFRNVDVNALETADVGPHLKDLEDLGFDEYDDTTEPYQVEEKVEKAVESFLNRFLPRSCARAGLHSFVWHSEELGIFRVASSATTQEPST